VTAPRATIRRRSRAGLTLLEVMVALSVIVVMMMMAVQAIDNAIQLRDLLEQRDQTTRAARVALGTIRRDVQVAFLTTHREAINTFQTVFVGKDDNPDTVWFASLAHQRLYRDSRESDETEITLWAEPAPGQGRGYVLYHREAPRIDEKPDEGGTILPLAHDVRSFDLRYLDPQSDEWKTDWDTRSADTPNRLPRSVQVGLVLIGQDPEDKDRTVDLPYLTTIMLEYAEPYQRGLPLGGTAGNGGNNFGQPGGNNFGQPGFNNNTATGRRPPVGGRGGRGARGTAASRGPLSPGIPR